MKFKKFMRGGVRLTAMALLMLPELSYGQEGLNLNEILIQKRALFEASGYDAEKIEKEISKFEHYWETRLDENGGLGQITAAFPELLDGDRSGGVFCGTDQGEWQLVGPPTYTGSPQCDWQAGIYHDQWGGYMEELYVPADQSYYVAASSNGGIWKRNAADPGWTNVTDPLNFPFFEVSAIVCSPFDQDHLFASCGGNDSHGQGILTSTDGGDTWSIMTGFISDYNTTYPAPTGNEGYINVRRVIVDPHTSGGPTSITLYALTHEGNFNSDIWKSTDSGVSWTKLAHPTIAAYSYWIDIEVDDLGHLLCATRHPYAIACKYWYYDSFGGWSDLTTNIQDGTSAMLRLRIATPEGNLVYALRDDTTSGGAVRRSVLESTDWGQNWTSIKTIPSQLASCSGSGGSYGWGNANPKDEIEYSVLLDKIFVGGIRLIEIDPNNLAAPISTSSIAQGHVDVRDIYFVNNGGDLIIYTANDGGISEVDYSAATYINLNGNYLPAHQYQDIGTANSSDEKYLGGVAHNHAFRYANGNWKKYGAGDGDAAIINPLNPDLGYVAYGGGIYRYDFIADNVTGLSGSGFPKTGYNQFGCHIELHPANPDTLYYVNEKYSDGKCYLNVWDELNNTWKNRVILDSIRRPGELAFSKSSPNTVYLAENGSGFGTTNLGRLVKSNAAGTTGSWTSIGAGMIYDITGATALIPLNEALNWRKITDIEVNPYNKDVLWISISGFQNDDEEYRVLMSLDGGATWREFSQGLPRYPVNSIVYIPATNGLMFAGTESGIFYRDNSMSAWECFNEDMPYSVVTDLDHNTCTGELVASTYGRGIWKSAIPTDMAPLTYTSTTTIPVGTYAINNDIVIKAPAVFTLLGTLEMANDKRITVEPGATLIIDGGTITNQCDLLWDGIYLGGTAASSQLSSATIVDPNQATLFIKNEGTIMHSGAGVTTQAYDRGFGHGARIFADNANFVDNRFDVEMLSYSGSNVSYFKNTDFLTTGPLGDPAYVDAYSRDLGTSTHVRLWEVDDVQFYNNRFLNTGTFDQDIRGTGIYSLDANYYVDGKCNAYDPWNCVGPALSFDNLSKGIVFNSSTGSHVLKVEENYFRSTVQGITVNGGTNIEVDDNHFLDYHGSASAGGIDYMESWGVYLDGTFCANVTDNVFSDLSSHSSALFFSRGVVCVNTSTFDTYVKRNVFEEGELIGVQAWLDNSALQISCNDFYSDFGIMVTNGIGGCTSLVPSQGTPDEPAGNRFFKTCSDNYSHIFFDGIDILMTNFPPNYYETIWHYFNYTGTDVTPTCISNDLNYLACINPSNPATGYVWNDPYGDFEDAVCDPVEGGGGDSHMPLTTIIENQEALLSELDQLAMLNEAEQLEALMKAEWLKEDEFGNLFPGAKAIELASLNRMKMQYNMKQQQQIQALTAANDYTQVKELIRSNPDYESYVVAIASGIDKNAPLSAELISELSHSNLNKGDYALLYKVIESLKAEGKTFKDLSEEQIRVLAQLATMPTGEGSKAAAILNFVGKGVYNPILDDFHFPSDDNTVETEKPTDYFGVYPNPSNDMIYLDLSGNYEKLSVRVFNAFGQKVYENDNLQGLEINVSQWVTGMYYVHLTRDGEVRTASFVVN